MKKMHPGKGKIRMLLIVSAIAAIMLVGGASAYFTSTDRADNSWTVGSVAIELQEEGYDAAADERTAITPNQELTKDPVVVNKGNNPAFVFVRFSVPKANVKVASQDGSSLQQALQELFDYSVDSAWTLMNRTEGEDRNTYLYTFGTGAECRPLQPEGETPVLFTDGTITFRNVVEGQGLEGKTLEIPVEAFAIQTKGITSGDDKAPSAVWAALSGQLNQ